jgi:choline dehydrogenase-like flavoprotein
LQGTAPPPIEQAPNAKVCYRTPGNSEGGMNPDKPIGVAGAGSIGCFVGGMLAAAGRRVALLARPRAIREIETHGLRLTSCAAVPAHRRADQRSRSRGQGLAWADAGANPAINMAARTLALKRR